MADGTNDGNGRVTLARVDGKIDLILNRIDDVCETLDDHELRLRSVERNEEMDRRLREVERQADRNAQRVGLWAGLQTLWAAALAAFAGWFGSQS